MKKQMIRLALSGVVLAFLYVWFFPLSKISQIEIRLEDSSSAWFQKKQTKILPLAETYKHKYFWQISLKKLAQKLQKTDKELDIRLKRKYPGQLIVFVSKKKTALLLLDSQNHFYSISYEGHLGKKRKPTEALDFPLLRGQDFEKNLSLRQKLLSLLEILPLDKASFCWDNLSEISYNKENQSFLFYLNSPRFVLELKSDFFILDLKPDFEDDIKEQNNKKIQNIEFVLNYLNEKNWTQAFIIAESDKKIIVKNKK